MKYIILFILLSSQLLANEQPSNKTYGTGLPRDLDKLAVADAEYPNWPLTPEQQKYAVIDGKRMKHWVYKIAEHAKQSKADGNKYWGRLPGTIYEKQTTNLAVKELTELGFTIERIPYVIPTDWRPKNWQASYQVAGNTINLHSAFPVGKTASTHGKTIEAEAVWVGIGAKPDFIGRDVKGKAVIIYSFFVPGGRSHSASRRAKTFNANMRATKLGAAMVINIMAVPGDGQFNPLGAPAAKFDTPLFTINQDEGFRLRDILGQGHQVKVKFNLELEELNNVKTELVVARLKGAVDEDIVLAAHTDGFFEGAMDNASGIASGLELARFYSGQTAEQRKRNLVFLLFPDHHHGEVGLKLFEQTYQWQKVATVLMLEHPSQTQLYWYNDDLMTSNAIGAFRWHITGSDKYHNIIKDTLREFGVSIYTEMNTKPKLTRQAPGFHIIDHVIYHTTLDIPELVPAEGLQRATRAFASIIDQVNDLPIDALK